MGWSNEIDQFRAYRCPFCSNHLGMQYVYHGVVDLMLVCNYCKLVWVEYDEWAVPPC